jgi:hypothetical protein
MVQIFGREKFLLQAVAVGREKDAEENKKGKENFWVLPARVRERGRGASQRDRSVRFGFKLPRAPRVRSHWSLRSKKVRANDIIRAQNPKDYWGEKGGAMFCTCKTASDLIFLAAFRCRKWKYSCGAGAASEFADE